MNRLKNRYLDEVRPKLKKEFNLPSDLAAPSLEKIVINIGSSESKDNQDTLKLLQDNLTALAGQKAVVTKAKKSISSFKLTKGDAVGLMVTLRDERMYAFLDKLINVVLPKARDFRGIDETSFDRSGNFNLGLREMIIFPEAEANMSTSGFRGTDKLHGIQITVVTTAQNKDQGKRLLELLGVPFRR